MIFELSVVAGTAVALILPQASILTAARFVARKRPKKGNMMIEGVRHTYSLEDFTDEQGNTVTDYAVAKILLGDQEVLSVLSRAEVELLQQAALLDSGMEVNAATLRRISEIIQERSDEVARAKSRRVVRG